MYSQFEIPGARHESVLPQRLTQSEDHYRALVETSADLILVTDSEGTIGYANQAALEILGYDPGQMLGTRFSDFVAADFEAEAASMSERAARGRPQPARRVVGLRRDGSPIDLSLSAMPLAGSDRAPDAAALIVNDVSAQQRRERELAQLIRDNDLILRSVGDGIIRVDPDGRITYANPAAGQILGCSPAELMGRDADELLYQAPVDRPSQATEESPIQASLRGETIQHRDEVFWRPDGTS
ncbi:MAG: PAS domain-containing protein, partial [Solirubrobacterales bacterium]